MTHKEEIKQEIFLKSMDRVGTARFEGKPFMVVSHRIETIWDVLSSHGRENTVKFLREAMNRDTFLRDVIIDSAIDYCREHGVPENRNIVGVQELVMRQDDNKCPVCGNEKKPPHQT